MKNKIRPEHIIFEGWLVSPNILLEYQISEFPPKFTGVKSFDQAQFWKNNSGIYLVVNMHRTILKFYMWK